MNKLEAWLELTKPVQIELKPIVEKMNAELSKTSKSGQNATHVSNYSSSGGKINMTIEGDAFPRPHDAFIRIKKALMDELGKKHKTGIRKMGADKYVMEFEVEQDPKTPVKTQFTEKITIKGKKCVMEMKNVDENFLQKNYADKLINLVNEKIRNQYYEGREEFKQLLWESGQKDIKYDKDPSAEMEKINWIRRAPGKGQFVYGREYAAIANTMKELLKEEVYDQLDFNEMVFPKFEHWDIPLKSGHASYIYPVAYFVSVPKNSSNEYWEEVMDYYKITGQVDKKKVVEKSENVGIMSYAQCPPFWPYLENRTIDEETLPLKIYDWSGPTYRNEAGGTHGIERVEEFNRIEVLYVGTKQQVIQTWKEISEAFKKFYSTTLDLEIKFYDVSPWWMAHAGIKDAGTKEVGTIDIDIYLPYRGKRDAEWLEVQNASSIGPKYPKAFNVKGRKEEIWSGCCGASLQRIVCAFLAQKGLDSKDWPEKVRKRYEQKIKNMKTLKFV